MTVNFCNQHIGEIIFERAIEAIHVHVYNIKPGLTTRAKSLDYGCIGLFKDMYLRIKGIVTNRPNFKIPAGSKTN